MFIKICSDESTARLTGQKITSFKDNEMKKEVHYKSDLVDSLISNIPNKNHFIEVKRSNKRLSTTSISKKSTQSTLPKKKIKVEDIKVEKADSGWVQSFFSKHHCFIRHRFHNTTFALIRLHILVLHCLNFLYSNSFER